LADKLKKKLFGSKKKTAEPEVAAEPEPAAAT
jgi:hypothetical protein